MKTNIPKVLWHHGTCDMCGQRLILVCHLGYDNPVDGYQICLRCMHDNIQDILFGCHNYKDCCKTSHAPKECPQDVVEEPEEKLPNEILVSGVSPLDKQGGDYNEV